MGKIKEKYLEDAITAYSSQLSKRVHLEIMEVQDEKTPDNASEIEELKIKQVEGERILKYINDSMYVIALAIEGKKLSTDDFVKKVRNLRRMEKDHITFVIGGSLGLSSEVTKRADYKLSFSDMTFPHQLMRVILLEQLGRVF